MERQVSVVKENYGREDEIYEYEGYQIRVHFSGDTELSQIIRNLAERRIELCQSGKQK